MNISNYDEIRVKRTSLHRDLEHELKERVVPVLVNKHNDNGFYADLALSLQLLPLLVATDGKLKGKKILDLGCGCNNPSLEGMGIFDDRMFEPWLCRGLYEIEAHPIGIDYGPLAGESFEHYQLNLLNEDSLKFIPDNFIDVANAKGLFSSPYLAYRLFRGSNNAGEELKKILMPQLERIVKPDGWFIYLDF